MTDPHFSAIGIIVADMTKTLGFYRRLGLEFPKGAEDEGHVEATLPGGLRIMFDTEDTMRSFDPSFEPPSPPGRIGLAFECDSPSAVDAAHAAITTADGPSHQEPFDAFWGQRYATVIDPDGNRVDLFAAL